MIRTIASQEDLAIFYTVANIKDKLMPKGPDVGKKTQRRLTYWTSTINHVSEAANNFLYEQLKVDPTSMATKTIQTAKEAVAVLMKENVMLKSQVRTMEESENIYRETSINDRTSACGRIAWRAAGRQDDASKNHCERH